MDAGVDVIVLLCAELPSAINIPSLMYFNSHYFSNSIVTGYYCSKAPFIVAVRTLLLLPFLCVVQSSTVGGLKVSAPCFNFLTLLANYSSLKSERWLFWLICWLSYFFSDLSLSRAIISNESRKISSSNNC